MSLNNEDVEKQITHMIAFIEQEAKEKVEEIDVRAEEEYNIEKGNLETEQKRKIMDYYDKKEKRVVLDKKIQVSRLLSQGRLNVLKAAHDHIAVVIDETRTQLKEKIGDNNQYKEIVEKLNLQGLFQLVEGCVMIRCRQQDLRMVENSLRYLSTTYLSVVGLPCKITVDKDVFLSPDCSGGVILSTTDQKIRIDNTLDSRLDMISQQLLPKIRKVLFGWRV